MKIRDFDQPEDDQPGDEAVARRMTFTGPYEAVIREALALKALGFTIIPVKTGSKDPSSQRWTEAAVNDPAVFLRNPGTHNYGVLPPPGCFCWDVDGDIPAFLMETGLVLGTLPETRIHQSPHGQHWFFRWPEGYKRPTGPMFGRIVTRWPFGEKGQGYVVGPGSELVNGENLKYSVAWEADIAPLPYEWAQAAILHKPPVEREHKPLAERTLIGEGERHNYLMRKARFFYGGGLEGAGLFAAVWDVYLRDCVPYAPPLNPREEVERAIGNVSQFERDEPEEVGPTPEEPTGTLSISFTAALEDLEAARIDPYLIDGLIVNNGLTMIAGHPKSMKSLGVLQAGFSFAAQRSFLGLNSLDCYPVFLYVTEEGSRYEMAQRLRSFSDAYPTAPAHVRIAFLRSLYFNPRGKDRVVEDLLDIERTHRPLAEASERELKVFMVLDPMRDFFPPNSKWSENDAQDVGKVKDWMRALLREFPFLSLTAIHHLRKAVEGGGGLDMAGSGAAYGAVDGTCIWVMDKKGSRDTSEREDPEELMPGQPLAAPSLPAIGTMNVETRGDAAWWMKWAYNPATKLFQRDIPVQTKGQTALTIIMADPGLDTGELARALGCDRDTAGSQARWLKSQGHIDIITTGVGRGSRSTYWPKGAGPVPPPDLGFDDLDSVQHDPIHDLGATE